MPGKKRGVRKFFSKPRKGYRTSGAKKCWRYMDRPDDVQGTTRHIDEPDRRDAHLESSDETSSCSGFQGFSVAPPQPSASAPLMHQESRLRPIRVLSLFDGIGTGYYILNKKLNLQIEKYYSSEIDLDAIRVQLHNFGDNVSRLGSVTDVSSSVLNSLGCIDLLIGGSPCEELSLVNWRRKGLADTGSGALFFEYVRILNYLKEKNRKQQLYWLFENTAKMEKKNLETMSRTLGCSPVQLCSSQFSPMKRMRNFWGNIPGMQDLQKKNPVANCSLALQDFVRPYKTVVCSTVPTLTTNVSAQRSGPSKVPPLMYNGKAEYLGPPEYEVLFGFPEHFTDCGLSNSARIKLLGKSWSVPVVQSILQPLASLFRKEN